MSLADLFDLAVRCHQQGDLVSAESLYRRLLEADPAHVRAHANLGTALQAAGRGREALACFQEAVRLNPDDAEGHNNLGNAYFGLKQVAEAAASYGAAVRLNPDHGNAHYNLGNVYYGQNCLAEAAKCFRQALRLNSLHAGAHNNLGLALAGQGQYAEAAECYRQALSLNPDLANAHYNLGNVHTKEGRFADAADCYRRTLRKVPQHADAHNNLGNTLFVQGRLDEAAECYRRALGGAPTHAQARNNLGNVFFEQGQLAEAEVCYREALRFNSEYAEAHNNLGNVLKDQGKLDEAILCYHMARKLEPDKREWHSNLLYSLLYHPRHDAPSHLEELRLWEATHALPHASLSQTGGDEAAAARTRSHANERSPERPIRIGYVSPCFRDHIVGRHIWPLLSRHDHDQFDVSLYADLTKPDALTDKLRMSADHWCAITGLPDNHVADKIRGDGIDVLVDLTLHMSGNRLPVFAHRPAPVQITFAGYPGSTGLSTIDYRLTDPYLDPPGKYDDWYAETSYRLPHSFWCYEPQTEVPAVGPLPARERGFVTFGCLNNFCKVNREVLELWARIMSAVPDSRLLLLAKQGSHRQGTLDFMAKRGVAAKRITFCSLRPLPEYLALYNQIDIALDTFPYNGHATSLDAFWMGVPVITLVGNTVVGRAGLSQLTNLGLEELAAATLQGFVSITVNLAGDLPRLESVRDGLRARMKHSPLMNAHGFAQGIEQAYRDMWRKWCGKTGVTGE